MFCKKCGTKLEETTKFCPNCGESLNFEKNVNKETSQNVINQGENGFDSKNINSIKKIHCPKCGSRKLQAVTETTNTVTNTGGGYSAGKGCLGYLLLGPFGLLCGNCGNSQKTVSQNSTKTFWICSDCGFKFRNLDDLKEEIEKKKKILKFLFWYSIILICMGLLCSLFLKDIRFFGNCFIVMGLITFILSITVLPKSIDKIQKEYEELKEKSAK